MKKVLGLAVLMLAVTGCSMIPIEDTPVYRELEVNMPAQEVFDNLTAFPYCGMMERVTGVWSRDGNSFYVKRHHSTNDVGTGGVRGQVIGDNSTLLSLHTRHGKQSKEMERYITRLQTGSCK